MRSCLGDGLRFVRSTHQLIIPSPPTLLAFGFVSPWLLWGLVLGGVPILIQWLHRRNYTERVWAAMRFLRAATKAQSRRLRFESLLLLAIRTLILLLAALALAEPFLESAGWLPPSATSVHRLLVIDTSLSLQYETEGRPVSEQARDAARRIIGESRPGDSVQIVTIGRTGRALVRQPAYDAAQVLAEVDQLIWSEEFGDVDASLRLVQQLLDEAPSAGRTELIFISDFQRSNWWPQTSATRNRLQRTLAELAETCELALIHVGENDATNTSIGNVSLSPLPVTLGGPVEITAEVSRTGATTEGNVQVELVENDRVVQTAEVALGSSGSGSATIPMRWREAGWHGLELRLAGDPLAADNHRWLAVDVRDELNVLLVNGRESGTTLGRASDYVELALAPLSPSDHPQGVFTGVAYRPLVVSEAEFARTDLSNFDCVFLCDVPFLSQTEQARLRTFVRAGGGLVIGAGPQLQLDAYNQWLAGSDEALLPVSLIEVVGGDDSQEPFHFAEPQPHGSPIVEPFVGNPQAGLTTANIYRYIRCEVRDPSGIRGPSSATGSPPSEADAQSTARVALAFANGDPAILESDYGSGRVLLVTTSLDDGWGSWALWPSFLPMMHRIVDEATAGRASQPQIVGDRVHRDYSVQTVGLSATLQQPDGRRLPGRLSLEDGATRVSFDDVSQSGLYRVLLGPPLNETELLAVNIDPRESDLTLLDERALQETLLSGLDAQLTRGIAPVASAQPTAAAPSHLTRWLLIVVFVLLLIEQVMAWNARWGLLCLCASPLLLGLFTLWPTLTIIIIAMALLLLSGLRWWPSQ